MKVRTFHPWLVVGFGIALCVIAVMVLPVLLPRPAPVSEWPPFLMGFIAIGCAPAFMTALFLPFWKKFLRSQTDELEQAPTSTFTKVTLFVMSAFLIIYCLLLLVYLFSGGLGGDWSWL